jgi:hypothetical protein
MCAFVLTPEQVECFVEFGYCMLPGAFPITQASAVSQLVWRRMEQKAGILEADPSTWPAWSYDIEEYLDEPVVLACFTDRLVGGIEQLVGQGRWSGRRRWGFWPVNFGRGQGLPWDYPDTGWHIDGNWFRHMLTSPKQGLLVVGIFTEIRPHWGGTVLALGSHKRTARVLARHPGGIGHLELFREVLKEPLGPFHEVTGEPGDAVLIHPFLFHTKGMKHAGPPRIISNTAAGLSEPMQLERRDSGAYSILEQSIRKALYEPPAGPSSERKICCFAMAKLNCALIDFAVESQPSMPPCCGSMKKQQILS